jgi:glycosyltransferase involved in cell wall biosynthesis
MYHYNDFIKGNHMKLSIVIPLLNESESLRALYEQIKDVCQSLQVSFEIIFVDDGSTDNSLAVLKEIHGENQLVKVISFNRNYGKSAALSEGFQLAEGDIVITMDADLQDDPKEIPNLLHKIESGDDLVSGWKKKRHDPIQKTIPSKFFNFTTSLITGIKIHDFNCGIKAYKKEVIKDIPVYGELHRYLPVLAHWQGFRIGEITVEHHPRKYGKTKFGLGRFFKGFFDLLTVLFITRYRQRPLHLFGFLGLFSLFLGIIISLYLTFLWFQGHGIGNRPLLFLGILLIIVGLQSFSIGLIGEMIANIRDNKKSYKIKELLK